MGAILEPWLKADFPVISPTNAIKAIKKYIEKYLTLKKSKGKTGPGYEKSRKEFASQLKGLFWIAPDRKLITKAIKADSTRLKNEQKEDLLFLKDQLGKREMTLGNLEMRRFKKLNPDLPSTSVQAVPSTSAQAASENLQSASEPLEDSFDSTYSADSGERFTSPEKQKGEKEKGQTIVIDRHVIEEAMRTAVSMNISAHQMTAALTKLVTSAGGDASKLPLSYTSAFRMKDNLISKDADNLKLLISKEINENDLKIELHFDGKLIQVMS